MKESDYKKSLRNIIGDLEYYAMERVGFNLPRMTTAAITAAFLDKKDNIDTDRLREQWKNLEVYKQFLFEPEE